MHEGSPHIPPVRPKGCKPLRPQCLTPPYTYTHLCKHSYIYIYSICCLLVLWETEVFHAVCACSFTFLHQVQTSIGLQCHSNCLSAHCFTSSNASPASSFLRHFSAIFLIVSSELVLDLKDMTCFLSPVFLLKPMALSFLYQRTLNLTEVYACRAHAQTHTHAYIYIYIYTSRGAF